MDNDDILPTLLPSKSIAVVYKDDVGDNGKTTLLQYDQFVSLTNRLREEFTRIIGGDTQHNGRRTVALSSEPTLLLPVVVRAVIDSRYVLVPFTFKRAETSMAFFKRCGVQWACVPSSEYDSYPNTFKNDVRKIHVLTSILDYVLLEFDDHNISCKIFGDEVMFIVQSSGTTGLPKLIRVHKRCILPNVADLNSIFGMTSRDVVLLPSRITFDASLLIVLLSWKSQASLLVVSNKLLYQPSTFVECLKMVTVLQCTPSLLHMIGTELLVEKLFNAESNLRILALGGEQMVNRNQLAKWLQNIPNNFQLFNIYGTSELSAWASIHEIAKDELLNFPATVPHTTRDIDWVPIGKPLSQTSMEVRDENGERVSTGYGTLFTGSESRISDVEEDEFEAQNNDSNTSIIMRSTGDSVYITSSEHDDNNDVIYFVGRNDNRVKRNGHLISLETLNVTVNYLDGVENACSVFYKDELILFLVRSSTSCCGTSAMETLVVKHIREKLASSYLPDRIELVSEIPINGHGKSDVSSLLTTVVDEKHIKHFDNERILCFYVKESWLLSLNIQDSEAAKTFRQHGGDSFAAVFFLNRVFRKSGSKTDGSAYETLFTDLFDRTLNEVQELIQYHYSIPQQHCDGVFKEFEGNTSDSISTDSAYGTSLNSCRLRAKEEENKRTSHSIARDTPASVDFCGREIKENGSDSSSSVGTSESTATASLNNCGYHFAVFLPRGERVFCKCKKFAEKRNKHATAVQRSNNVHKTTETSHGDCLEIQQTSCAKRRRNYETISTRLCWKYNLGKCVDGSPLVYYSDTFSTGVVLIGCHSKKFAAISLHDGTNVWELETADRVESTATVSSDGKLVIFGCYDKNVYFIDISTGHVVWKFTTGDIIKSTPTCHQLIVYVGCHDKHIYALDYERKMVTWRFHSKSLCCSKALIIPEYNAACFALLSGALAALDLTTGDVRWKYTVGKPIFTSPLRCGHNIVFSCVDGVLYCVNPTGNLQWSFNADNQIFCSPVAFSSPPYIGKQGVLFACNGGRVYRLDENGTLLWKCELNAPIVASPVVLPPLPLDACRTHLPQKRKFTSELSVVSVTANVAVVDTKGNLYLLHSSDGCILNRFSIGGDVFSTPVAVDDRIVFGCRDDSVYCLQVGFSSEIN